jgi:hypothetical protein
MQIDMDVSGRVLRTRMPDRRSGSRFNVRSPNPELETRNPEQRSKSAGMTGEKL